MTKIERRTQFLLVATLAGIIWFSLLGYRDLFDPDEGRYAEIPAAMVDSGDWLTPRLNGIKYFEKPVLQYWASAAIFRLVGKSNASARLVPALAGYLGALFAAFLAYRLFGARAAFFAFLFTVSSLMWVALGHILNLDMLLSVCLFFGMGSLAIAQSDRADKARLRLWMLAGWVALALAVLTKGLIGVVLPAASVIVYSLWQRDWHIWKHLQMTGGLLLFFLLVSPWFAAVSVKNPEFPHFFFIHEHWDRYTTSAHHREGPIWYFVPFLIFGLMPWLAVSLSALAKPTFKWLPETPGSFNAVRLLWSFVAVTFVFFSLGNSKLPAYILPVIPVIMVLAAHKMANMQKTGFDRWLMALLSVATLIVAFNLVWLTHSRYSLQLLSEYRPWLLTATGLFALSALVLHILARKPLAACTVSALASLLAFQSMLWGAQSLASVRSGRMVAEAVANSVPADTPVFTVGTCPESAVFYLGRTLRVAFYTGEFEFGFEQEPELQITDTKQFLSEWYALKTAAMIINSDIIKDLFPGLNPRKIVYWDPKRAVIVRNKMASNQAASGPAKQGNH
jgi:4-amino-4-deoxy-L-arabinose transferase-like glycosyltransferase